MYTKGLSMGAIAKFKKVSLPTVLRWIRKFSTLLGGKLDPVGKYAIVEIDEMWHFFERNSRALDPQSLLLPK